MLYCNKICKTILTCPAIHDTLYRKSHRACRGNAPTSLIFVQRNTRCASDAKSSWLFCKVCRRCAKVCRLCQKNKKAMKSFDFTAFSGAMEGTRTPGLLIRSQSLYPAELPTHTFRSEQDVFYHAGRGLSTVFCGFFDFIFVFLFFRAEKYVFSFFQHSS